MPVEVVVIIPAYKQPRLLIEAAFDALHQKTEFDFAVAIADDGCPLTETHELSELFAAADGRIMITSRLNNGGLSANRNSAVDAVISAYPDLKAITFLDSDDRLDSGMLQHFYNELFAEKITISENRIGWVYTDPYQFGGIFGYLRKPKRYSALWHLWANSNSATSLIHVDVFKSGCKFDESMHRGSEDWDFWLQAVRMGFVGKFTTPPTFRYRRRPESMTSNAVFYGANIAQYVREKNKDLYSEANVLQLAARDALRYCVLWCGEEPFCQTGYFLNRLKEGGKFDELISDLVLNRNDPLVFQPSQILIAPKRFFNGKDLEPFIKDLMIRAGECFAANVSCVVFNFSDTSETTNMYQPLISCAEFILSIDNPVLENGDFAVVLSTNKLLTHEQPKHISAMRYTIHRRVTANEEFDRLLATFTWAISIIKARRPGISNYFGYIDYWQPENINSASLVPRLLGVHMAPPFQMTAESRTALILDRYVLDGPEFLSLSIFMDALAKKTQITIIIPEEDLRVGIANNFLLYACDIVTLNVNTVGDRSEHYLGARIVQASARLGHAVEDGRLVGYNTLIFAGFPALLSGAFARRRQGVSIIGWWARKRLNADRGAHNSVLEPGQRISDFSDHLLAYEHAIDCVIIEANRDLRYINTRGFPVQKIIDTETAIARVCSSDVGN